MVGEEQGPLRQAGPVDAAWKAADTVLLSADGFDLWFFKGVRK
jgi:hypothetical protein